MRIDLRGVAILALGVLTLASGGCGSGGKAPVRIGVLSDCEGNYAFQYEPTLAAAELPLLDRGARRLGDLPSDHISSVTVGGRKVELVLGCASSTTSSAVAEVRRLVEREGVDLVVGPELAEVEAVKHYARRQPHVAFLTIDGEQSATLRQPLPNVFSFSLDWTQRMAGLGTYAYRLGWRRAVIIGDDYHFDWGNAAGVVAEFCALGGDVVKRIWLPPTAGPRTVLAAVPKHGIDGIFYVSGGGQYLLPLLNGLPLLRGRLTGRVIGQATPFVNPATALGNRLAGAVYVTGGTNSNPGTPEAAYAARLARAFPKVYRFPGLLAPTYGFGLGYYESMEAALAALERVHGDLSGGERRFMAVLAEVQLDGPDGHVRLDAHRQAIGSNYLNRLSKNAAGKLTVRTFETIPNVEQTFGGLFGPSSPPPGRTSPPCTHGHPPPWAR